jgi:hypothetical protein
MRRGGCVSGNCGAPYAPLCVRVHACSAARAACGGCRRYDGAGDAVGLGARRAPSARWERERTVAPRQSLCRVHGKCRGMERILHKMSI